MTLRFGFSVLIGSSSSGRSESEPARLASASLPSELGGFAPTKTLAWGILWLSPWPGHPPGDIKRRLGGVVVELHEHSHLGSQGAAPRGNARRRDLGRGGTEAAQGTIRWGTVREKCNIKRRDIKNRPGLLEPLMLEIQWHVLRLDASRTPRDERALRDYSGDGSASVGKESMTTKRSLVMPPPFFPSSLFTEKSR